MSKTFFFGEKRTSAKKKGVTPMADYKLPTTQESPFNSHELYGEEILANWDSFRIGFNPKIDAVLDLWFFHNGMILVDRRIGV